LFSILPSAQYWVRSTDHEAPHYEVFFTTLLPRPFLSLTLQNILISLKALISLTISKPFWRLIGWKSNNNKAYIIPRKWHCDMPKLHFLCVTYSDYSEKRWQWYQLLILC
jgi:hypothetical protein